MDISYPIDQTRFNYRVGGIIIKDNQLLVITNEEADYFYTIGGRVKINETSLDAIKREVFEETSLKLEPIKLLYFHENFFSESITNEKFHEIALYFLMSDDFERSEIKNASFTERETKESIQWVSLDDLAAINLKPAFLKTQLLNLDKALLHLISTK